MDPVQSLEGKELKCLKEFRVPQDDAIRYDETKIMNSINRVISLWYAQPLIIDFYSNLLRSFVGEYSAREMWGFRYLFELVMFCYALQSD